MSSKKTALLLLNLGSPHKATPKVVGKYLTEFLNDPYVIDIPWLFRKILVNLIIVPRRKYASAEAYQQIWQEGGSPLLIEHNKLCEKVQKQFNPTQTEVFSLMRYGQPSIISVLEHIKKFEEEYSEIILFPLYPQYAYASTESSLAQFKKIYAESKLNIAYRSIDAFFDHPLYIKALAESGQDLVETNPKAHVVFSFHGVPERQITRVCLDQSSSCLQKSNCCEIVNPKTSNCYRAQCFATAHSCAQALKIAKNNYDISFQSRLGRTPWIKPYTDELLVKLAKKGIKDLVVFCPSFVADNLETLEEIAIRGQEDFIEAGGRSLKLVPSLNNSESWVKAVVEITK